VIAPDLSDGLRRDVELALAAFSLACAPDGPKEIKRTAAIKLERAVIRLQNYILNYVIPMD
jgi:hypothetical protein